LLVHHQHAGRDAGSIKEAGGQANDGFEPAEVFARFLLFTAAEKDAVAA